MSPLTNDHFVKTQLLVFCGDPLMGAIGSATSTLPSNWSELGDSLATQENILQSGHFEAVLKVIFFLAICAAAFVTFNYYMNLTDQGVCICDGASLPDRYAMLFRICVCTMVEVGTISLFGYVLILSRSEADGMGINVAKYSLSKRFQVLERLEFFFSRFPFFLPAAADLAAS
ncbi:hypothetical protein OSTOST_15933, partial [Ostertagia ostertagi]